MERREGAQDFEDQTHESPKELLLEQWSQRAAEDLGKLSGTFGFDAVKRHVSRHLEDFGMKIDDHVRGAFEHRRGGADLSVIEQHEEGFAVIKNNARTTALYFMVSSEHERVGELFDAYVASSLAASSYRHANEVELDDVIAEYGIPTPRR